MDIYTDSVVCKKSFPGYKLVHNGLLVLAVMSLLMANIATVFLIGAVVFAIGAFLVWRGTEVEYEYIHTNNTLDIDKVIHNARRRSLLSIDLNQVLQISPLDETRGLSRLKKRDYTGDGDDSRMYAMICVVKGEKTAVLLQLDDRMLASLKKQIPGKFV